MEEQLNNYVVEVGQSVNQVIYPDSKCRYCGQKLEFVDYDRAQDAVWVACPACVAANDKMHDYYSMPFAEVAVNLGDALNRLNID